MNPLIETFAGILTMSEIHDALAKNWRPMTVPVAAGHDRRGSEQFLVLMERHEGLIPTPEPAWIIHYEDADRREEIFAGEGATEAALKRFELVTTGYNCHLFRRVSRR